MDHVTRTKHRHHSAHFHPVWLPNPGSDLLPNQVIITVPAKQPALFEVNARRDNFRVEEVSVLIVNRSRGAPLQTVATEERHGRFDTLAARNRRLLYRLLFRQRRCCWNRALAVPRGASCSMARNIRVGWKGGTADEGSPHAPPRKLLAVFAGCRKQTTNSRLGWRSGLTSYTTRHNHHHRQHRDSCDRHILVTPSCHLYFTRPKMRRDETNMRSIRMSEPSRPQPSVSVQRTIYSPEDRRIVDIRWADLLRASSNLCERSHWDSGLI